MGEIEEWLMSMLANGHTGYLYVARFTLMFSWNVLSYENFYAMSYEQLELDVQQLVDELLNKERQKRSFND